MRFGVLGALEVVDGDVPIKLGEPQQRLVWAVLVCHTGQVVSDDRLVDAVWGTTPPRSAVANLRLYVAQLRKIVGWDFIARREGGYVAQVAPAQLDSEHFEALLGQARAADDPETASGLYVQALGLWRGAAFGRFADHPAIAPSAQRLEELRLVALEEHIAVRLDLGEHVDLGVELAELVAAHPLRENLHRYTMLALYRSGRPADALATYQRARRLLADELGLDPGPRLEELHQAILCSDPALDLATSKAPNELPADLPVFTGRDDELVRLRRRLLEVGGAMAVCAIGGIGGIGKTALAVHLGHQIADRFPDGQLYLNLQGSTPDSKPLEPIDALGRLLRSLGADTTSIPTELDEAARLYRSRTHGRRLLVVLDNAYDATQVRPLLPGSPTCAVMITSRRSLTSLDGAHQLTLDVLGPDDARELLTGLVGGARATAEPETASTIVRLCGYLPLAISIAAARLRSRTTWSLRKLAERLATEDRRLSELEQDDRAIRASLCISYRRLDYPEARAFRLCALPGGPHLDTDAAAALLDLPEIQTEDLLDHLVDLGLLENPSIGRYRYHDLVRLYAQEQAAETDPPAEQDQALHRLLTFYTASQRAAIGVINPTWRWPAIIPAPQHPGRAHADPEAAQGWLHTHVSHLIDAIHQASGRAASLSLAADQLYDLHWMVSGGFGWRDLHLAAQRVADTAADVGDRRSEALARLRLGCVCYSRHVPADAEAHLDRATELTRTLDDPELLADMLLNQGLVYSLTGRTSDGIRLEEEAAHLYRQCGQHDSEAIVLSNLSRSFLEAGRPERSLAVLERAAVAADLGGGGHARGSVFYERGIVLRETGRQDEAINSLTQARRLFREHSLRTVESYVLYHLAETYRRAGQHSHAIDTAEQCRTLSRQNGDDHNVGRALTVLGQSRSAVGEHQQGRACLQEAYEIFERLGAEEADEILPLLSQSCS